MPAYQMGLHLHAHYTREVQAHSRAAHGTAARAARPAHGLRRSPCTLARDRCAVASGKAPRFRQTVAVLLWASSSRGPVGGEKLAGDTGRTRDGRCIVHRTGSSGVRIVKFLAPFACLAALAVASGAAVANAATTNSDTAHLVTTTTAEMRVVGFDKNVAAAHGYDIRTAASGEQYSVKRGGISAAAPAMPSNVVGGNCGFSYVYEYGIGNRAIELYTGYSVIHDVIRWHWQVRLDDRGGSSYRNYSGWINNGIWQVDQVIGGLTRGGARASVIRSASWALLDTGAICVSGGPWDDTIIY
jgi:hypothetical protein